MATQLHSQYPPGFYLNRDFMQDLENEDSKKVQLLRNPCTLFPYSKYKMWNFATHAGTGLAVAGLSATYYALARKNFQLERENSMIGDDGDHRSDRREEKTFSSMTTSQMLLKKELDNLSQNSGLNSGLNSLNNLMSEEDDQQELPSKQYSGMQIGKIISRVNTSSTTSNKNSTVHLQDSHNVTPENSYSHDSAPQNQKYVFCLNKDENCYVRASEEEKYGQSQIARQSQNQESTPNCKRNSVINQYNESTGTTPIEPSSEERFLIERTKSPIVYYKNLDFGKRSAGRTSMQISSDMDVAPGFDIPEEYYEMESIAHNEDSDKYRDSTRFIFPPILSESRLSVCDHDQDQDELLIDEADSSEIGFDQEISTSLAQDHITSHGLSQMDEIRDYNLQLQFAQEIQNISHDSSGLLNDTDSLPCYTNLFTVNGENHKDDIVDPSDEFLDSGPCPEDAGDCENDSVEMKIPLEMEENIAFHERVGEGDAKVDQSIKHGNVPSSPEENSYPQVCCAPSTSILGRIPENSWMGWPVRVYADFASDNPTAVLIFLGAAILMTALLGKLFITMGEWFEYVHDIDYNPDALMEH